ncbi:MAG: hypothetical protein EOL97_13295 [Spirochaetia bacterium]|nr:hypothetical protein [Spirochaetia bacterium]
MAFNDNIYFNPLSYMNDVLRTNTYKIDVQGLGDGGGDLELLCNKFTLKFTNTAPVELQWISGTTNFSGRSDGPIEFSASFYTGVEQGDTLTPIVKWRNTVLDYAKGIIHLASKYKKVITVYWMIPDMSEVAGKYIFTGVWPVKIDDVALDVSTNEVAQINVTFRADRMRPEPWGTELTTHPRGRNAGVGSIITGITGEDGRNLGSSPDGVYSTTPSTTPSGNSGNPGGAGGSIGTSA